MNECTEPPSRRDIWKMFDLISPTYDRVNRMITLGLDQRWRKKMCTFLPDRPSLDVLDCATGTGDQIIALMEQSPEIRAVVGLDLAEEMMAIGKKKIAPKSYADKVSFVTASAEQLPFQDNSFDCVTISFGIRNIENFERALSDFYRVLKAGGKALILEGTLPRNCLWKAFHLFYLRYLMPKIGGALSKQSGPYHYLNQTIETFPQGEAFCSRMKNAGFAEVKAHPLLGGIVTIYEGTRHEAP